MKLVILDGHTCNPGDLDWSAFESFGDCVVYPRTQVPEIVARALSADIVITNKTPLNAESLASLPHLRYIGVLATGFNVVDVEAARARGIPVCNVPEYGTEAVAQHVFALALELANRAGHHAATVRAGQWSASPDFCYWDHSLVQLHGRTLGVVGLGRIGRAVARIGSAFGMGVIASGRASSIEKEAGITRVDLDRLFEESDVVSLHCPLTPETTNLVNAARLSRMKAGAFLINTARGGLINEADLTAALTAGKIGGAGLDVLCVEPPPSSHPLFAAPNCLITPHHAWAAHAARSRLIATTAANIRAWLDGTPHNVVN